MCSVALANPQVCIPDWPMYNRNPVTWLEEIGKSNKLKESSSKAMKPKKDKSKKAVETKSS